MDEESGKPYYYNLAVFCILLFAVPSSNVMVGALIICLLLLCSALISSSEVAFFSLTVSDFHKLEQENTTVSEKILKLKDYPKELLATILISNNFINIGIVILSDFLLQEILPIEYFVNLVSGLQGDWLVGIGVSVFGLARYIHFGITVVGVTFLLVLFGEVAPKVYAKVNHLKIAKLMAPTLYRLSYAFSSLSNLLIKGTSVIERRLESKTQSNNLTSMEDIDQAIELTVKDRQDEIDILKGIVKFGELSVKQIMRSRVDVVAVELSTSFKELLAIIRTSGYSRIPVYEDDFDNVVGILYVKDLIKHLNKGVGFEWQVNIRLDVYYVPEAKKISDLLKEFQLKRQHIAIVVDEYGGSSGIVTLEDIMEEVIGDIKDEFDDLVEVDYEKLDDFNYVFDGKTLLNDVCRVVGVDTGIFDDKKGDADSIAGLMLEMIGFIPTRKGRILVVDDYVFEVVAVNKRRIEQVKLTLPQKVNK